MIEVNGVYVNHRVDTHPRTVVAVFGKTVRYTIPTGPCTWDRTYKVCSLRAFKRWATERLPDDNPIGRWAFLDQCRKVVAQFGQPLIHTAPLRARTNVPLRSRNRDCNFYLDDRIVIVVDRTNGAMSIGRLPVDDPARPHLSVFNPAILVDREGHSYRYHGEYITLTDHVESLLS